VRLVLPTFEQSVLNKISKVTGQDHSLRWLSLVVTLNHDGGPRAIDSSWLIFTLEGPAMEWSHVLNFRNSIGGRIQATVVLAYLV
jgi:hypothetical protein